MFVTIYDNKKKIIKKVIFFFFQTILKFFEIGHF